MQSCTNKSAADAAPQVADRAVPCAEAFSFPEVLLSPRQVREVSLTEESVLEGVSSGKGRLCIEKICAKLDIILRKNCGDAPTTGSTRSCIVEIESMLSP